MIKHIYDKTMTMWYDASVLNLKSNNTITHMLNSMIKSYAENHDTLMVQE